MRSGPPDPPSIFIGSATMVTPVGGSADMSETFSKAGMSLVISSTWVSKFVELSVVDRGRVDTDSADPARYEQFGAVQAEARKMQLGDGFRAAFGSAHVGLAVWIKRCPTGVEQYDRAFRDLSVLLLEGFDVRGADPVVNVRCRLFTHVDHEAGADQLLDRNLVRGVGALGKVDWRIQVRAAMLGGREVVGAVVVARLGRSLGDCLLLEHLGGRPVD